MTIASDKSPDRLGLLEQRLISRFASGIVASELKARVWEAHMDILRQQAKQAGINVPSPCLHSSPCAWPTMSASSLVACASNRLCPLAEGR